MQVGTIEGKVMVDVVPTQASALTMMPTSPGATMLPVLDKWRNLHSWAAAGQMPPLQPFAVPMAPPPSNEQPANAGENPVLTTGSNAAWAELEASLKTGVSVACLGVAGSHSKEARKEAATKLIGNHTRLLGDVCNASETKNIDQIALTQTELIRVPAAVSHHVDEGLRETARRLIGRGGAQTLHPAPEAVEARAACARYLDFRIQSHPEQKPGRTPDMSAEAAAAMKAVLIEVGTTAWQPLRSQLTKGVLPKVTGAAAAHSREARAEAAAKLIGNHFKLLLDVCNPMKTMNAMQIELGLTQLELRRVNHAHAEYVDEGLREVARRLMGGGTPETLNTKAAAMDARAQCARYLDFRIQSTAEQKPGRAPDMSAPAAAAMKAVLCEVGSTAWEPIHMLLDSRGVSSKCEGVANDHSASARKEAASKVLGNHFRLLQDVCNPSQHMNIDGVPLTQQQLTRVDAGKVMHVDEGLREAVRRLVGRGLPIVLDNSPAAQDARAGCACYLTERIQSAPAQKPGRKPDMSPQATAALLAVLEEVAAERSSGFSRKPSVAAKAVVAMSLASELELLAAQLRLDGEITQEQAKEMGQRLVLFSRSGSVAAGKDTTQSAMCAIM